MTEALDQTMLQASEALAKMDYLACEALCLEALAGARAKGDWGYYARILLPLQEARRQRRIIAAEGVLRLGSADLTGPAEAWLAPLGSGGCITLTLPHGRDAALELAQAARAARRHVEVLWADNLPDAPTWTLRSFRGPAVACPVPAPAAEWIGRWLPPARLDVRKRSGGGAGDWFIDATEALGDAAIAQVVPTSVPPGDPRCIEALEGCLEVVADHEIILQRLFAQARAAGLRR